MRQIGKCRDKNGNISPLFEENGKHYRRNPNYGDGARSAIQEYDRQFDAWISKVKTLLGYKGSLRQLMKKVARDDPDGAFDSGASPAFFADMVKHPKKYEKYETIEDAMKSYKKNPPEEEILENPPKSTGYCMKCKKKVTIKDGKMSKTKTGGNMMKGLCENCGTKVAVILPKSK